MGETKGETKEKQKGRGQLRQTQLQTVRVPIVFSNYLHCPRLFWAVKPRRASQPVLPRIRLHERWPSLIESPAPATVLSDRMR